MTNCSLKIAITGGGGQLALALQHHPLMQQFQCTAYSRKEVDITDDVSIAAIFAKAKPDVIINTAAYTAVDKAETEMLSAMEINYAGSAKLASACQKHQIPMIHVSTDYIFDGKKTTPYREDDAANPINYYGKSKYLSELAVRDNCEQHIILRVSGIFSEYGHNFLKTILRLAQEKKQLQIVADQITCPTYAGSIAGAILTILPQLNTHHSFGTYHYCSNTPVSWHQFALAIVAEMKKIKSLLVEDVKPIPAAQYKTAAHRPAYSVLNCDRIQKTFGITQPAWEKAIKTILEELP